jgi:hypothetical protein
MNQLHVLYSRRHGIAVRIIIGALILYVLQNAIGVTLPSLFDPKNTIDCYLGLRNPSYGTKRARKEANIGYIILPRITPPDKENGRYYY